MKILITRADGFIGSHLTETIVRAGHQVKAFVFYNSYNSCGWLDHCSSDVKDKFEIFSGDIRDPYGVKEAMKGCEAVLHLAALIAIPYSYHSPDTYVETNIKGTLNILQAARELEITRVIHTSTSEVYGTAKYVPINEDHPVQAQSPYSASKIAADQIAYSFYASFNLPVIICRPFNTYGSRQSNRAVIPTIITSIASGNNEIELGSISPTRDFNYVKDICLAYKKILESDKGIGEIINFGTGFEISIKDTAYLIAKIMNKEIRIKTDIKRIRPNKSEVFRLCADNSKAKNIFNWSPTYYGIEGFTKGLEETVDWMSNSSNLRYYKSNIFNI